MTFAICANILDSTQDHVCNHMLFVQMLIKYLLVKMLEIYSWDKRSERLHAYSINILEGEDRSVKHKLNKKLK